MAVEKFTAYTEVDPGSTITVDTNTISWDDFGTKNTDSYVYLDKGADFFYGDFTHTFILERGADIDTGASFYHWLLSNDIDNYQSLRDNYKNAAGIKIYYGTSSTGIYLNLLEAGEQLQDGWAGFDKLDAGVDHYITVVRDDDGGANNTGRYTVRICTVNYYGLAGAVLQDTLMLDCSASCQYDFRYVFGCCSMNTGSSYYSDGYTKDLNLYLQYRVPVLTGSALSVGDLLRWDGTSWVNYSDNKFHKIHTGKVEHFAGNNGLGQSFPSYVNYAQEATIAGTRTSDVIFTRTAGTWVVDALIGQYVYSYAIADTDVGSWLPITDNDETTLTVDGVLYAGCDNVKTCVWNPMQNIYAHGGGNTLFAGGVFDGESVWLVPHGSDNLVKVNPSDGSMTTYAHGQGGAAFAGGVFDGESVWLVPYSSDNLVKVNPSDGSMTTYAHGEAEGTAAFWGGVFDGESVWLVPYNSDNLVKVNPSDGSMTTYAHGQGGAAFAGGVFDGESIWLVPDRSDNLVKVNPADGSMTTYAHGQGDYAFIGGVFDGESIWLAPYRSNNLVKVNPSDGSMTTYAHGQGDLASQGGVFDGESVWLVPYDSDNLVKVDPSDGSMTTYAHGQGGVAFAGGVFDGESVWLVPYYSDNLVSFIPPRFGRPSLHTNGPLNVGGTTLAGKTPSYVKLNSPNGTDWYLFIEDDGTVKIHNAIPTVNADGDAVGDQTD